MYTEIYVWFLVMIGNGSPVQVQCWCMCCQSNHSQVPKWQRKNTMWGSYTPNEWQSADCLLCGRESNSCLILAAWLIIASNHQQRFKFRANTETKLAPQRHDGGNAAYTQSVVQQCYLCLTNRRAIWHLDSPRSTGNLPVARPFVLKSQWCAQRA